MSNLVIVAIPDENDRVWKVSSEKIPHLTILFLGESDEVAKTDQITQFVEHAANTSLTRFYLPVDRRGVLGEDEADVLFFTKNRWDFRALYDFRSSLLKDDNIRTAVDSSPQHEGPWLPHLTLGYKDHPAKTEADDYGNFYDVSFNKIAVWVDDYDGPEFLLRDQWDDWETMADMPLAVAMSGIERHGADPIEQSKALGTAFMTHFGVKADSTFKIGVNDQGKSTGVIPTEESMSQTAELTEDGIARSLVAGAEFMESLGLEHHGVKGMRWGVRKSDTVAGLTPGSAAKGVGKGAKTAVKGVGKGVGGVVKLGLDVQFENKAADGRARNEVIGAASKAYKKKGGDRDTINNKPEYQAAKKLKNRLRHPRDPLTKAYRKEQKEAYIKQLETTANSKTNASGTRQYTIRERGIELPAQGSTKLPTSKYFWDISTRKVEHAEVKDTDPFTRLEVVMDEDGFITDLKPVPIEDSIAQSVDLGAHFLADLGLLDEDELEHYGVKGMRWGVRNVPSAGAGTVASLSLRREAPVAVATTSTSKVPHGNKRKTKIKVEGGQNHDAHSDAIQVAEAKAKLRKSGPAALSNKELRDVATRVQLESQVTQLTASPGRKFISSLLKNQGNQAANKVVQKKVNSRI